MIGCFSVFVAVVLYLFFRVFRVFITSCVIGYDISKPIYCILYNLICNVSSIIVGRKKIVCTQSESTMLKSGQCSSEINREFDLKEGELSFF